MKRNSFLFFIFTLGFISLSFHKFSIRDILSNDTVSAGCNANENLTETCQSFIGRCRKGGINSEFPGQFYNVEISVVKSGSSAEHKKAWKLLNDSRFVK